MGDDLSNKISELAKNGGIAVVLDSPDSGKSVQLHMWVKRKRYPFYACRLGDRYNDIPARANQAKFVMEISSLLKQGYRDRISGFQSYVEQVDSGHIQGQTSDSLARLPDALGAWSEPSNPGVLVIDGQMMHIGGIKTAHF